MCQFSIVCLDAVATTHNLLFLHTAYVMVCLGCSQIQGWMCHAISPQLGPASGNGMGLGRDRAMISTAYRKFFRAWQGHYLKGVPAAGNVERGMTSKYCLDIAEPSIMDIVAFGRGEYTQAQCHKTATASANICEPVSPTCRGTQ